MTAKQQALKDIKIELKSLSKSFIAFTASLNPIIKELVNNQLKTQQEKNNGKK